MTALTVQSQHVSDMQVTLAAIAAAVRSTDDPETVKANTDKVRMAREWARIHKVTREVHADLIRIEVECLRRLAQLGDEGMALLTPNERKAAAFFASLDERNLDAVIKDFGDKSTACAIHRAHVQASEGDYLRGLGRRIARGEEPWDSSLSDEEKMAAAVQRFQFNTAGAIEQLLDQYTASGSAFFVEEVADDLISKFRSDDGLKVGGPAIREGIREVCRKAIRSGRSVTIFGTDAPRFVTCSAYPDSDQDFMRVPFENATLPQLEEMVALRRKQLEEDQSALARLVAVRDHLAGLIHPGDRREVTIGLALTRASLGDASESPVWNPPERELAPDRRRQRFGSQVSRAG
jgi:ribosomal protein L12E/L44/L45/RPP1/RPP2